MSAAAEQKKLTLDVSSWRKQRAGQTWKVYVVDRAIWLSDELSLAGSERAEHGSSVVDPAEREAVEASCSALISDAARTLQGGLRRNIANWFTGHDIERAWTALHAAQAQLLLIQDEHAVRAQLPEIEAGLRRFARDDPRRIGYAEIVEQARAGTLTRGERRALRQVAEACFMEADAAFGRIRGFRNALLGTTLFIALVLALIAAFSPSNWLPLCAEGTAETSCDAAAAWQIYLVGGLGGLLGAVFSLRRLQGFRGPYSLPLVQAALKIPTGALTGLIGALFVQNAVFDLLAPQEGTTILAYVALFGYAQEAFTRFVDARAGELMAGARAPSSEGRDAREDGDASPAPG